jgi:hypothetical protein
VSSEKRMRPASMFSNADFSSISFPPLRHRIRMNECKGVISCAQMVREIGQIRIIKHAMYQTVFAEADVAVGLLSCFASA